jgi:hypothetical protein
MITEDYVSFETAKLLREKGFREPTLAYAYGQDMIGYYNQPRVTDDYKVEAGRYPLPTLQMAMKWLREVHKLHIEPHIQTHKYYGKIYNLDGELLLEFTGESPEQACESAIKYCLKYLI